MGKSAKAELNSTPMRILNWLSGSYNHFGLYIKVTAKYGCRCYNPTDNARYLTKADQVP